MGPEPRGVGSSGAFGAGCTEWVQEVLGKVLPTTRWAPFHPFRLLSRHPACCGLCGSPSPTETHEIK